MQWRCRDFNEASYLPVEFVIIVTGKASLEGSTWQELLCPDSLRSCVHFVCFFFGGGQKSVDASQTYREEGPPDRGVVSLMQLELKNAKYCGVPWDVMMLMFSCLGYITFSLYF